MNARLWHAMIQLDNAVFLDIRAPLVVVNDAMARTLMGLDPHIQQGSRLEVQVRAL